MPRDTFNLTERLGDWDPGQQLRKSPYEKTSFNLRRPLNAKLQSVHSVLDEDFDVDQSKLLNFMIFLAQGTPAEIKDQYRRFRTALASECEFTDDGWRAGQAAENVLPLVRYHRPGPRRR